MNKISEILDNGKKMKVIKEVAIKTIGAEEIDKVWEEARNILADILNKYPTIQPKEQTHTDLIFPHIAVYKVLFNRHADAAMKIMEEGEAITAKETGSSYQKIVKIPFGKTLFFNAF